MRISDWSSDVCSSDLTRAFDVIEAACGEVALAPSAQVLALHCSPSLASKWLGPMLPKFMQTHPGITIRLTSGADPIDLTRIQELDLALSSAPPLARPAVTSIALGARPLPPLGSPPMLRPGVPLPPQ